MERRKRRFSSDQYKSEVVALVRAGGKSIGVTSRELDLTESSVRAWVQQAEVDAGEGPEGAVTTAEKEEFRQLRRENRELRMEREILKKATAFFAKENR